MDNRQKKKSLLDRFMAWLLVLLQRCFIGRFFTSYNRVNDKFEGKLSEGKRTGEKRLARFIEKNRVINFVPKIFQFLMRIPLRDYGIMLFMTGAVVSVLYPLNDMILFIDITFEMFVTGVAVCACSIPLFFSSRSLADNVLNSKTFNFLLFDFLGMDDEGFRTASEKGKVSFATFAFLIGAGLGVLSYFLLPSNTALLVFALIVAYCTLRTPEVGAIVTVLLIPFVDIFFSCIFISYTFLCYVIKVLLGKRIFRFQYFDLWVSIAIVVLLVCGINYSDPLASLKAISFEMVILFSYFLFANLIYSKAWFRRSILAFTTSSIVVALVAIAQAILRRMAFNLEFLEHVYSQDWDLVSSLGSSSAMAQFMVIAIPFAIVHMISEKKDSTKFVGFLMAVVMGTALVLSNSAAGLVGLIVGSLLVFAFYKRMAIYLVVLVPAVLITLYFTLPSSAIEAVFSWGPLAGVSVSKELHYIKDTFLTLAQYPFGLNIAGESVMDVLGTSYVDSLPIQLLASYGFIGLAAVLMMMVMFARVTFTYSVNAKNAYRRVNGCAGLCSTMALLTVGLFSHVWLDKRIFLIFVMTIALSMAYVKIDREEEAVTRSQIDITKATVDIQLKESVIHQSAPRRRYVHAPSMKRMLKKQEKIRTAEAKEFSNTDELIIIKRNYQDEEQE